MIRLTVKKYIIFTPLICNLLKIFFLECSGEKYESGPTQPKCTSGPTQDPIASAIGMMHYGKSR